MSDDQDRLGRWARLKAEAGRPPAPEAAPAEEVDADFIAALPRVEEIDAATDIRGFLRKGVPDPLRNAALAKAWLADPAIRDRIPDAVDYAENYNAPHMISGWGQACPQEAKTYVERTLDAIRDDAPPRAPAAQAAAVAPEPRAEAACAETTPEIEPAAVAQARPNRGEITKNRSRHGSALPQES